MGLEWDNKVKQTLANVFPATKPLGPPVGTHIEFLHSIL